MKKIPNFYLEIRSRRAKKSIELEKTLRWKEITIVWQKVNKLTPNYESR